MATFLVWIEGENCSYEIIAKTSKNAAMKIAYQEDGWFKLSDYYPKPARVHVQSKDGKVIIYEVRLKQKPEFCAEGLSIYTKPVDSCFF